MSIKREKLDDYSGSTNNKTETAAGGALYLYRVIIRTSEVCHSVVNYRKPHLHVTSAFAFLPSATKLRRLFLQVSVCTQGGCLVPGGCAWSRGGAWSRGVPGPGGVGIPACTEPPPGRDGYCCGRYASYWNAFLFMATSGSVDAWSLHVTWIDRNFTCSWNANANVTCELVLRRKYCVCGSGSFSRFTMLITFVWPVRVRFVIELRGRKVGKVSEI